MKTLINKVKGIFIKPSYKESEVLDLIELEAYSFSPDWIDGIQKHKSEISFSNGYIDLTIRVKVSIKEGYTLVYNDPIDEPEYEVILTHFSVELNDHDGFKIPHNIDYKLIKEALSPIEIYN